MIPISAIKTKLSGKMHGTTISKISDFNGKCREAAMNMLTKLDPPETIRRSYIENAIYNHVYNYVLPEDIKGTTKIITLRPSSGASFPHDSFHGTNIDEFSAVKENNSLTIETIEGVKTLRLSRNVGKHVVLNRMDSLSVGGTITALGDAENLKINTLDFISGSASVQFDLDGATGGGGLKILLDNENDLTDYENVGALFHWLQFQNSSKLNKVKVKWGQDDSNYWEKEVESPHDRNEFIDHAWALMRYDWNTATKTGNPDPSKIKLIEILIDYDDTDGEEKNVRIDNVIASKGESYEMLYYSDFLFQSEAGLRKIEPTVDSDVLIVTDACVNIFYYELLTIILQEVKGRNAQSDLNWIEKQLGDNETFGLYYKYGVQNPSQAIQYTTTTYEFDDLE